MFTLMIGQKTRKSNFGRDDECQIAAGNAEWSVQFRFAVDFIWSRVPELWTLGV